MAAPYTIAAKQSIAQTPDLRVTLMTLDPGQEIPWHTHSLVTDTSFCLKGSVEISLRGPGETVALSGGDFLEVPVGRPHRVACAGGGQCRILLVQGVGEYDFLPA